MEYIRISLELANFTLDKISEPSTAMLITAAMNMGCDGE
jgi:hypothetical protein